MDAGTVHVHPEAWLLLLLYPYHILLANDLVVLKEPTYDAKKNWVIVPLSEIPGWLERSSAPVT